MAYLTEHEKKRRKIGWIVFLSILLSLALAAFLIMKICRVQEVEVKGNETYDDESIRQWVLNDKYSWSTPYVYLKYRFFDTEPVPFIDTMEVDLTGPKSLSVTVYEKGLIGYLWDENTQQNVYFDKDGFVIEISANEIPGIPRITGIEAGVSAVYEKLDLSEKTLRTLLTLTQNLVKYGLMADSIDYSDTGDMVVTFQGVRANLGTEDYLTEKILRLSKILPYLNGESGMLHLENWTEDTTDVTFDRD